MVEAEDRWPFGSTDGGPSSRPLLVKMEGVLIAILKDDAAGERAKASLTEGRWTERDVRLYTSEQMVAFDEAFRSDRNVAQRVVSAVVDDTDIMAQYVQYAHEGGSALWVLAPNRDDANAVVRQLSDQPVLRIWYYGTRGVEILDMA